jgi:hypothetical protein
MSDWAFLASPIGRQEREQLLGSQRPRAPVAGSTSITPPTMPICYSSIDAGLSHSGLFRRSACRRSIMEVVHVRCAGLDVSKRDAKVCVRVRVPGQGRRETVET